MTIVRFWGTRGSIPTAQNCNQIREKLKFALEKAIANGLNSIAEIPNFLDSLPFHVRSTYGGESCCVQLDTGEPEYYLFDLGSGARKFAVNRTKAHGPQSPQTYHVFLSHVHHDHIMGFPFFVPAFIPGNKIRIFGCHDILEQALRKQQETPSFPVPFDFLSADIEFIKLETDVEFTIGSLTVTPFKQLHHGDSYGYRVVINSKIFVYSTDSEHKINDLHAAGHFVNAFRDADLVVFDAMYSLKESISIRADWGHSSNVMGVDLCRMAGVKRYCMYHHEPINSDARLDKILKETRAYEILARQGGPELQVTSAYDGLEIEL